MKWKIEYSKEARKFIDEQNIWNQIREGIKRFLLKIKGEDVNIDVRKLVGDWKGYYRIRMGKIRIIFCLLKEKRTIFVEKVDHRGNAYK